MPWSNAARPYPHGRDAARRGACRRSEGPEMPPSLVSLDGQADIPLDRILIVVGRPTSATPAALGDGSPGATTARLRTATGGWSATSVAPMARGSTAGGSTPACSGRATSCRSPRPVPPGGRAASDEAPPVPYSRQILSLHTGERSRIRWRSGRHPELVLSGGAGWSHRGAGPGGQRVRRHGRGPFANRTILAPIQLVTQICPDKFFRIACLHSVSWRRSIPR